MCGLVFIILTIPYSPDLLSFLREKLAMSISLTKEMRRYRTESNKK